MKKIAAMHRLHALGRQSRQSGERATLESCMTSFLPDALAAFFAAVVAWLVVLIRHFASPPREAS